MMAFRRFVMGPGIVAGRCSGVVAVIVLAVTMISVAGRGGEIPADGLAPVSNSGLTPRIINGSAETGWPAVGALVFSYPWQGYLGSYCSATLIDKRWVLTAAHCAIPTPDFPIGPGMVYFMITSDARPNSDGSRPKGVMVQTDYFVPHPAFENGNFDYDLALVHLTRDVTEVDPLPLNVSPLSSEYNGRNFYYIGFGLDSGNPQTGLGLKRSASIPVSNVDSRVYYSDTNNAAICFGDSGGPSLYKMDGVWKVVGLNSAVYGYRSDPCVGMGVHVRVDAHSSWIRQNVSRYPPSCNTTSSACLCDDVCNDDGTCDNVACGRKSCSAVTACVLACGEASDPESCANECYVSGTDQARAAFDNEIGCYTVFCSKDQMRWTVCMEEYCSERYNECNMADQPRMEFSQTDRADWGWCGDLDGDGDCSADGNDVITDTFSGDDSGTTDTNGNPPTGCSVSDVNGGPSGFAGTLLVFLLVPVVFVCRRFRVGARL